MIGAISKLPIFHKINEILPSNLRSINRLVSKKVGYLFVGQMNDTPFTKMKYTKALKELDNKIIECKFEGGQWIFMRERTDKSFPNSIETAKAVCNTIKEPVTKEALLGYIEKNRFEDDAEMMPPPSKMIKR